MQSIRVGTKLVGTKLALLYATYAVSEAVTDFCHFEPLICSTKFIDLWTGVCRAKTAFGQVMQAMQVIRTSLST